MHPDANLTMTTDERAVEATRRATDKSRQASPATTGNAARGLADVAARDPMRRAIVFAVGRGPDGRTRYSHMTYRELDDLSDHYAHELREHGLQPGDRALLLVRPGPELIALMSGLLKMTAVPILIDPGMGRRALLQCIAEAEPVALIGVPQAHLLRRLAPGAFSTVRHAITVGRYGLPGAARLNAVAAERRGPFSVLEPRADREAAIIFTSGSTGIPKGVAYTHQTLRAQLNYFRDELGMVEGEIDLPGMYAFALFDPSLGTTAVLPELDARAPARVDPAKIVEAVERHQATYSFGSPTFWSRVADHCIDRGIQLPSLRRVFIAGAPVSSSLLRKLDRVLPHADVQVPYGATEALPITMIGAREIVGETDSLTAVGRGHCVGRPLPGMTVRIIGITEQPIQRWSDSLALAPGEAGEVVVRGPTVTSRYLHRPEATARAKIADGASVWHRMGDVGYLDEHGRLWICGRIADSVQTEHGPQFSLCCEAIFERHPSVARCALVGVGAPGRQRAVLVVQPRPGVARSSSAKRRLASELFALGNAHPVTRGILDILFHRALPVDVRHNAKILRGRLAAWAQSRADRTLRKPTEPQARLAAMSTFEFRGHRVRYLRRGSGRPMVFLHNGGNSHRIWDAQIERFSPSHEVFALDLPGFGESDSLDGDYSLPAYGEMLTAFLEQCVSSPAVLVGNCMGSAAALHVALRHPGKVHALVLFHVLTDRTLRAGRFGSLYPLAASDSFSNAGLAWVMRHFIPPPWLRRRILRDQYGRGHAPDRDLLAHLDELYGRPHQLPGLYRVLQQHRTYGELDEVSRSDGLRPVCLVWGRDNRILPVQGLRALEARLRPERAEVIDGCGHLVMCEEPERVNQIIDGFLDQLRLGESGVVTCSSVIGAPSSSTDASERRAESASRS